MDDIFKNMIKRIKCKTCDEVRDMLEQDGQFICSSCGTVYDLEYIANSFFTPLMIEISYMINDLHELCGGLTYGSDEDELEAEIDETEELSAEDKELIDEDFLSSEEISKEEKAIFCLVNVFSLAIEQNNPDGISAFIDTVLKYDKTNFVACLIKALDSTAAIPRHIFSRVGDAPVESLDSVPVALNGEDDITISQALFNRICNNDLAKHLQSVLNLLMTSILNAPSEGVCLKVYHIAALNLDLYEVLLEANTLHNLKMMPTLDRYREYLEYELAMSASNKSLKQATTARLNQLGARQVDFDVEEPHFHEFFPDVPNWGYHLAEMEYQTVEDIWEKAVIARVDRQTGKVDAILRFQVLDGIYVVAALLQGYTNVDADEVNDADLPVLRIAQKMISRLLNVMSAVKSFSFERVKGEDVLQSIESAEELTKKLAIIDREISKRIS